MKLELYNVKSEDGLDDELIDTFILDDLEERFKSEVDYLKNKDEKEKKKKAAKKAKEANSTKDGNSTSSNDTIGEDPKKKIDQEEELESKPLEVPKVKISVEHTRSGIMLITKATVGVKDQHQSILEVSQVRKPEQMTIDMINSAKLRLKWYKKRDEDKINQDIARNDFEALLYKMREWLREDDNEKFVKEEDRVAYIEKLNDWEDWLYEDGSNQNATVYQEMHKNMSKDFVSYNNRKDWYSAKDDFINRTRNAIKNYNRKNEALAETKPWINETERADMASKINDFNVYFEGVVSKEAEKAAHDDPGVNTNEVLKKMKGLQKLWKKVSEKKKPKPPKEETETKAEDAADKNETKKEEKDATQDESSTKNEEEVKKETTEDKADKKAAEDL